MVAGLQLQAPWASPVSVRCKALWYTQLQLNWRYWYFPGRDVDLALNQAWINRRTVPFVADSLFRNMFFGDNSAARSFKLAINSMVFWKRPVFLVGIYNQQFRGIISLMVFDFKGYGMIDTYTYVYICSIHLYNCSVSILYRRGTVSLWENWQSSEKQTK